MPNPNYLILKSPSEYSHCQIWVPDLTDPLAGINVGDKYYSLLKVVLSQQKAVELAEKLAKRGDNVLLTPIPKGYAIWVWEAKAYLKSVQKLSEPASPPTSKANSPILDRSQYKPCKIRVPDVKKRLAAIEVSGKYYSFLRNFPSRDKALKIARQLSSEGDKVLLTQTRKGYLLWVFEPDAYL
ncbi:MAG: hypothetical protein GDA56_20610 [Hormoscilla sp. GM7CHS1pb]|nr:hypothetical protein [Hormoscilla sp. GM7CHS1pb]